MRSLPVSWSVIANIRAGTSRPFNLNFFSHVTPVPDAVIASAWQARLVPYYAEYGIDPSALPAGAARLPFNDEWPTLVRR